MSRRVCCHSGQKLPDNHTCGARCRGFPDCISIPIDVVFQLIKMDEQNKAADREASRRIDVLQSMHDAVVIGLAAQGAGHASQMGHSPPVSGGQA